MNQPDLFTSDALPFNLAAQTVNDEAPALAARIDREESAAKEATAPKLPGIEAPALKRLRAGALDMQDRAATPRALYIFAKIKEAAATGDKIEAHALGREAIRICDTYGDELREARETMRAAIYDLAND